MFRQFVSKPSDDQEAFLGGVGTDERVSPLNAIVLHYELTSNWKHIYVGWKI